MYSVLGESAELGLSPLAALIIADVLDKVDVGSAGLGLSPLVALIIADVLDNIDVRSAGLELFFWVAASRPRRF